jgi:hypothetical protein
MLRLKLHLYGDDSGYITYNITEDLQYHNSGTEHCSQSHARASRSDAFVFCFPPESTLCSSITRIGVDDLARTNCKLNHQARSWITRKSTKPHLVLHPVAAPTART